LILLDADALTEILEKRSRTDQKHYSSLLSSDKTIGTTAISLHELLYGLKKYAKPMKELLQMPIEGYTK